MKKKKRARAAAADQETATDRRAENPEAGKQKPFFTPNLVFGVLLAGVAALRLGLFYATADDPYMQFRVGDEAHYHEWALKIQNGQWARGASFFTTPLYAYFLAFLYSMGGSNLLFVRLLNVLLGMGTVVLTYGTARRLFDQTNALITVALLGFCTAPIFYEWFPEKTSLVLFLTALSFYLLTRATASRSSWLWLAAGLSVGVASLGHMLFLVMLPAAAIFLVMNRKGIPVPGFKALALFTFAFLLGVSPATVHNYLQDRDFVLVSSNGGQNFYVSNHAGNFTGEYISPPFSVANIANEEANFKEEAERRTQQAMKPSEVSRFWFRQGLLEIAQEPALALTRWWNRLRWAAGADEPSDTRTYEFYQERYRILKMPFWGFGFVSCLGLAGLFWSLPKRRHLLGTSFVVLFIAGLSVFFVYGRYRLPLLVPFSMLAAVTLSSAYDCVRQRRPAVLGAWCLGIAVLVWILRGPVLPSSLEVSFFPDYYNQGNKYWNLGNYDLALAEYEKALYVRPGDHPGAESLFHDLAGLYLKRGQFGRAEVLLQEAAARFPENREFHDMLQTVRLLKKTPLANPKQ
jgi:4-amino-4-deoxy-L-arabinose transferase-like glycosyltransferase